MTRESDIEDYLKFRVKEAGGECRKVSWQGRRGAPDRWLFIPGHRPFWCELKAPGEKLEEHQEREHKRMRKYGERVLVIDSFEGVDALFR